MEVKFFNQERGEAGGLCYSISRACGVRESSNIFYKERKKLVYTKALRLYFYLLARGVVRERELCEALDCTKEELMQLAQVLMDSAIPIRIGEGFWLEDDDVFSLFLHEEEMETLKDFQRLLRETNPKLQRRLADMVLLRAAADDLLRLQGGRASRQNLQLLDEMIEKAVKNRESI